MDAPQQTEQNISWDELYVKAYVRADRFYRQLLAAVCVVCGAGIGIAVMFDVIIGACVAICGAMLYSYFSSDEIYKRLGLRYTHVCGRIHVIRAVAKYGDTLVIPSRLVFADVTTICDGAFSSPKNQELTRIYIPKSIKRVGHDPLGDNSSHVEILYEGNAEEWEDIEGIEELSAIPVAFVVAPPSLPLKSKGKKAKRNNSTQGQEAEQNEIS